MEDRCKEHHKLLYGNGRPGILDRVSKLEQTVEHMNEHLESLSDSYSALAKSQIEYDTTQKLKANAIKTVGIVMGLAIPLTALIITLL